MAVLEFVVIGTPVSVQASSAARRFWQQRVATAARQAAGEWVASRAASVVLSVAYFYAYQPVADLDNIVKPLQDALKTIAYEDDIQVVDLIPTTESLDEMKRLASAVDQQPGWRYEVTFVSQPVAPDIPAQEPLASDEQVNRLLKGAEELGGHNGNIEAAAMLAWSALETILRRSAQTLAPEIERQSSAKVLKHLYGLGHIKPDVYERLWQLFEFRTAVAHGFEPRLSAPAMADVLPDIRDLQHAA